MWVLRWKSLDFPPFFAEIVGKFIKNPELRFKDFKANFFHKTLQISAFKNGMSKSHPKNTQNSTKSRHKNFPVSCGHHCNVTES